MCRLQAYLTKTQEARKRKRFHKGCVSSLMAWNECYITVGFGKAHRIPSHRYKVNKYRPTRYTETYKESKTETSVAAIIPTGICETNYIFHASGAKCIESWSVLIGGMPHFCLDTVSLAKMTMIMTMIIIVEPGVTGWFSNKTDVFSPF